MSASDTFYTRGVEIKRSMEIFLDWLHYDHGGVKLGDKRYVYVWCIVHRASPTCSGTARHDEIIGKTMDHTLGHRRLTLPPEVI